jgi:DNA-binding transcriptional regulator YhcF (GntR family)
VIVRVDPASPLPAYEQLRAQIADLIAGGALAAGAQLPTIRQLATDLDLAKDTVARAYEVLERDGLVERQGRRGTTVADRASAMPSFDVSEVARSAVHLGIDEDRACQLLRAAMRGV